MIKTWFPDILKAVYEASEAIMDIYEDEFEVIVKSDDSPVTLADKQSSMILTNALRKTGIKVISEEENIPSYEERKNGPIWLVDPLDGTKDFIKKNDEFCICIAYVVEQRAVFGIIASPTERKIIFGGEEIPPALINYGEKNPFSSDHLLKPLKSDEVTNVIYSKTHYTPNIDLLVQKLEKEHGHVGRILKGSALKFFDLVTGKAQVYPRLWPTMEWDIAAGNAIYSALGGEIINYDTNEPLLYNKADLYNPKFLAKPKNLKLY
ncbi:MAG: 3'(2'),5'-bisphosphate nucleotidase CysQ [Crocinitomicaceae bacterium]|nr:3'(2'),5'-bisphosphate nucleotidase CysQ [Crocinitomicaceae bacterium]